MPEFFAGLPYEELQPIHLLADGTKTTLNLKASSPVAGLSAPLRQLKEPWLIEFGWAEMVGRRPDQEDTFCLLKDFGSPARHLVGIFDGHGGPKCAELCASMFPSLFADALRSPNSQKTKDTRNYLHPQSSMAAMRQAFNRLQRHALQLQLDDGCTAITTLFSYGSIVVASVGDCRAVVFRRDESYLALSWDHKPFDSSEYLRIRRLGGFVTEEQRVNGVLATSRAIGDTSLQPYVTYEPQLTSYTTSSDDLFLVVACDGLWDVLSEEDVFNIASKCSSPFEAAAQLRDCAYNIGSTDNITVVVAALPAETPDWQSKKKASVIPKRRHPPTEPGEQQLDLQRFEPGSFPPLSAFATHLATASTSQPAISSHPPSPHHPAAPPSPRGVSGLPSTQPTASKDQMKDSSVPSLDGDSKLPKTLHQRLKAPFRRKKSSRHARSRQPTELEAEMDLLTLQMKNEVLTRVGELSKLEWIVQRSNTDALPNSQDAIVLSGMTAQAIRKYISVISQRSFFSVESFLDVIAPPDETATPNERLGYLLYAHPEAVDQINEAASQYVSVLASLISLHYRDEDE